MRKFIALYLLIALIACAFGYSGYYVTAMILLMVSVVISMYVSIKMLEKE